MNIISKKVKESPKKIIEQNSTWHKCVFCDSRKLSTKIKPKSVDMILTSPPYPMVKMWDELFKKLNPEITEELINSNPLKAFELMNNELFKVYKECIKVLKDDGVVCINIGDATRTTNIFSLFPNHQKTIEFFQKNGFTQMPSIIWSKPTNSPNKFMGSGMLPIKPYVTLEHEYILIFRKKSRDFLTEEEKDNRAKSAFFQHERNEWCSDIWKIKGVKQKNTNSSRERTAAYPLDIPYRLINLYSVQNDTILDPFGGTGTTAIAALGLKRNSISAEIEELFKEDIKNRILGSVNLVNELAINRIEKARTVFKKNFKYFNYNLNIPVKTSQEQKIVIPLVKNILFDDSTNTANVEYCDNK